MIKEHYKESTGQYYYPIITSYISNRSVIALVVTSKGAIERVTQNEALKSRLGIEKEDFHSIFRKLVIGPSPTKAKREQHIRSFGLQSDFGINPVKFIDKDELPDNEVVNEWRNYEDNLIHYSDSSNATEIEIKNMVSKIII